MPINHTDFETFSRADLTAVGAHRYAEDPSTEALCVSVGTGEGHPIVVDLHNDPRPEALHPYFQRIEQGEPIGAHNAEFERSIMTMMHLRHGWPKVKRSQFHCTAAQSVAAGTPRSLNGAGGAWGLSVQKNPMGRALLKKFAMPQKDGSRIMPEDEPEAYSKLLEYCQQDVIVESELYKVLPPLHPFERSKFLLDSLLNDRGFPVDVGLIKDGISAVGQLTEAANQRVIELTGGLKPTQRNAILSWLQEEGAALGSLQAQEIEDLIAKKELPPHVIEVLELRLETSRAALAKLPTMLNSVCGDGRIRGCFLYYGAHTGRWSGVRVQPHNFARGDPEEQDRVLDLLELGGSEMLELFYGNPLVVLSQSIRGFIATPYSKRWVIADYKTIEARVLAWVADELGMLEVYRKGFDPYRWMAAKLYNCSMEAVTSEQRRIAKNLVLGCGYGLGGPGFVDYSARAGVILTLEFATTAVKAYRQTVPNIVNSWYELERYVHHAVQNPGKVLSYAKCRITHDGAALLIYLPSGRPIRYPGMSIRRVPNKYRPGEYKDALVFNTVFGGRVVEEFTYGAKLIENIVQGISCDIMTHGMINAERGGYPVSLTVHDEVGADMDVGQGNVKEFMDLLTDTPPWAVGCPIGASGFEARRYRKD